MDTIGKRIAKARESQGWSQKELGERAGYAIGTVTNWEQGRTEPRPSDLIKLAHVLEVDPCDLLRPKPPEQEIQNNPV